MACEDCERRELAERVDELERVKRYQGIALVVILTLGWLVLYRLDAKGILKWDDLLKVPVD